MTWYELTNGHDQDDGSTTCVVPVAKGEVDLFCSQLHPAMAHVDC
jgi:hypothetical protein